MSRIFTIDDDPIQIRVAKMIIQKNNLFDHICEFTDVINAIENIKANIKNDTELPDYILLDLELPEFNGWDFLNMFNDLKSTLKKSIKVIIVSSSIDESEMARSQKYSFVKGFISKPLSPTTLKNILSQYPD